MESVVVRELPIICSMLSVTLLSGCITTYVTSGESQIIDTGEVMELLMDPIHEDLKDFIENPPEKRADWRGLYVAAYTLAETNNLLFSRTDHGYMLQQEWRDRVVSARATTVDLADAIKTQADYEVIKSKYLAVVQNCNDCHLRYDPTLQDAPQVDPPTAWGIPSINPESGTPSFH